MWFVFLGSFYHLKEGRYLYPFYFRQTHTHTHIHTCTGFWVAPHSWKDSSSLARDWTHALWSGAQSLSHWSTRVSLRLPYPECPPLSDQWLHSWIWNGWANFCCHCWLHFKGWPKPAKSTIPELCLPRVCACLRIEDHTSNSRICVLCEMKMAPWCEK